MGVVRSVARHAGVGDEPLVDRRADLLAMATRFTTAVMCAGFLAYVASGICSWYPWAIECW
jgi:hypothetical protein